MPINTRNYTKVARGLKWNRRTDKALFDVLAPGGTERFRRVLPFDSVEKALAAFTKFRTAVKAGKDPDEAEDKTTSLIADERTIPTFVEYVTQHLDSIWGGTSPSTRRGNTGYLRTYLLPFFGAKRLDQIAEIDVKDFKTWCRMRVDADGTPKPLAPPTINFALRRFREVMNNAKSRKVIDVLPPIKFEKESENKNEF